MAFYVTTPIYYVNAAPHLGHAYTTIGADILARHMRQRGEEVFFLTGTDEHGEPVAQQAEREGVTPKELADRNAQRFQALMPRLDASIDFFIRTSDPRHKQRVQEIMQRVHYNEARAFITGGLQDVSLSRAKLTWGVEVPWDPAHVFYVWFDALLNYVTALSFARDGEDLTDRFWPATYHVMGKDILKFHAVIWPALLLAAELPLPEHLFIHGYLLMDGEKMSKSL